ncbi:MAG: hypothetical protein ABIG96_05175 [Candidatus Micrarchaeota archaeon]
MPAIEKLADRLLELGKRNSLTYFSPRRLSMIEYIDKALKRVRYEGVVLKHTGIIIGVGMPGAGDTHLSSIERELREVFSTLKVRKKGENNTTAPTLEIDRTTQMVADANSGQQIRIPVLKVRVKRMPPEATKQLNKLLQEKQQEMYGKK